MYAFELRPGNEREFGNFLNAVEASASKTPHEQRHQLVTLYVKRYTPDRQTLDRVLAAAERGFGGPLPSFQPQKTDTETTKKVRPTPAHEGPFPSAVVPPGYLFGGVSLNYFQRPSGGFDPAKVDGLGRTLAHAVAKLPDLPRGLLRGLNIDQVTTRDIFDTDPLTCAVIAGNVKGLIGLAGTFITEGRRLPDFDAKNQYGVSLRMYAQRIRDDGTRRTMLKAMHCATTIEAEHAQELETVAAAKSGISEPPERTSLGVHPASPNVGPESIPDQHSGIQDPLTRSTQAISPAPSTLIVGHDDFFDEDDYSLFLQLKSVSQPGSRTSTPFSFERHAEGDADLRISSGIHSRPRVQSPVARSELSGSVSGNSSRTQFQGTPPAVARTPIAGRFRSI